MYSEDFLRNTAWICSQINPLEAEKMVNVLLECKLNQGRLFILGVGGSSANASHAVNDFRKIVGLETYAPTDNVAELTARTNDNGWETVFIDWLKVSHLNKKDVVMILSVGGGDIENKISENLVYATRYAKQVGCNVLAVVSRGGGYAGSVADCRIVIPSIDEVTPYAESFQSILLHLLVTHPDLRA